MKRGQLWKGDLGRPRGSAPAFIRPVVVISADVYNVSRLTTVTVAALTTNLRLARTPGNVLVPAELGVLPETSVVNVTQIATIDRVDLLECLGDLPAWLMAQLDAGIRRALALP